MATIDQVSLDIQVVLGSTDEINWLSQEHGMEPPEKLTTRQSQQTVCSILTM